MDLSHLPPDERKKLERDLALLDRIFEQDPLQRFHACPTDCGLPGCHVHPKQHEFLVARSPVQAAFAGNRFGKTTALVVKCLIQHVPLDALPERLRPFQRPRPPQWQDRPVMGRFMCPSAKVLHGVDLPAFRDWTPREWLLGGSFDKAWDKTRLVLHFKDGGQIDFFTYEQDADKLVGASLDYVAYDEPPPEPHRSECVTRLIDRNGFEMFAMTPVNMQGGGIGWVYRKIWKRREHPDVTVVQGSIHDNPVLDPDSIRRVLEEFPEEERRAREYGEFVHFGGMIYPGGFEHRLFDPPSPDVVKHWDVVVGIDPGLKNAAFIWAGFDNDQRMFIFDELLLQDKTPADYARGIKRINEKWRIQNPLYVIDPSARNRSLVNAENVEGELGRLGIYTMHGQNAVEPGVQQVRRRLQHKMLLVSKDCRGLRDEAEEYRAEDRPDGEFRPVKENDHRLDALRYAVMTRPWGPYMDDRPAERLGWVPGTAPPARWLLSQEPESVGPLGSMS